MICVIGGGAAGMMAAIYAARAGAQTLLLERNEKLGKKIYITGKGRCNFTNIADGQEFLANVSRNPRFLYSALSFLTNEDLISFFEESGVPVKLERGGRYFPQSDHASDITRALERELKRLRVKTELNARVASIDFNAETARWKVSLESGRAYECEAVIACCGGAGYPSTGSDGRFNDVFSALGLDVVPLRPGLVPIETRENWPSSLTGISLKNVALKMGRGKRAAFDEMGEMLFTHFGISGPLALSLSNYLPDPPDGTELFIDLKPALNEEKLITRLNREIEQSGRKQLRTMLETLMPRAMAPVIASLSGLDPEMPVYRLNEKQVRQLAQFLKAIPLTISRTRGFNEAIITRGGLDVKQVVPSTMGVRAYDGLYVAGEALDVDALTGGFNLRIAFSTGALAGQSAAEYCASLNGGQ